nr:MAG TPA: hypothetical protein [Caudoviricetes sp.]
MLTREETIKVFKICHCGEGYCDDCPMQCEDKPCKKELSSAVLHYLKEPKENEPALSANSASSEILKNINSTHFDDSTLLDICQEGIEEMAKIALDDYPNEFLTGYIVALKKNIERLRGEQSD